LRVARRLGMLATAVVMPGGLLLLCAVGCIFLLMRSDGGRRVLTGLRNRIPARIQLLLRRALLLTRGERLFLASGSRVRSQ
jgi:hypothetical protein